MGEVDDDSDAPTEPLIDPLTPPASGDHFASVVEAYYDYSMITVMWLPLERPGHFNDLFCIVNRDIRVQFQDA